MKPFVEKLKELKLLLIFLGALGLLFLVSVILSRLDVVLIALVDFRGLITFGLIFIVFILGGVAWIKLSPTLIRPLVMLPFALSTFTAYIFGFMYGPIYGIVGMLLIIFSGMAELRKYKFIFIAGFVTYCLFSIILYQSFEPRSFLLNLFAFGVATLGLFFPEPPFNRVVAGATLITPLIVFSVFGLLFGLGSSFPANASYIGNLAAPFEEGLVFRQREVDNFFDSEYVLEIYRPLHLGFYKELADYSTYNHFPTLSAEDFSWEKIDDDTYRLHFYYFEGSMQYSFLVEI